MQRVVLVFIMLVICFAAFTAYAEDLWEPKSKYADVRMIAVPPHLGFKYFLGEWDSGNPINYSIGITDKVVYDYVWDEPGKQQPDEPYRLVELTDRYAILLVNSKGHPYKVGYNGGTNYFVYLIPSSYEIIPDRNIEFRVLRYRPGKRFEGPDGFFDWPIEKIRTFFRDRLSQNKSDGYVPFIGESRLATVRSLDEVPNWQSLVEKYPPCCKK